jgi:predicted nucleic acid-binding protein
MKEKRRYQVLKKIKVYLDTSTISHLFAEDTPEKMEDTNRLWKDLAKGQYEVYISQTVLAEISKCPEPKRGRMLIRLRELKFEVLEPTDEVRELGFVYIDEGVLNEKNFDDCLHIAYAVIYNCDVIVSWNFKHLVNFRTINRVKIVNSINGYSEIGIISPTMLIEEVD